MWVGFCALYVHGAEMFTQLPQQKAVRSGEDSLVVGQDGAGENVSCVDIWEEAHFSLSGIVSPGIEGLLLV